MRESPKKKVKCKSYPWEIWLAEEFLTLVRGEQFECSPYIMAQQFRNKVKKYTRDGKDLSVSIGIYENVLRIHIMEAE